MPFDFKPEPEYDGTMSLQYSINGGDASAASPEARAAANRLVGTYQTNIYGFINNQRRLAKTSGFPQSSRYMNLPGLEVGHRRNGKHETVSINAKPGEAEAIVTQTITNHDGYIAVIYATGEGTGPTGSASWDVKLNGQKIDSYDLKADRSYKVRVYAFGPTALICQSVNDQQNAVLNGRAGLRCTPSRKKVGSPEHPDAFGYFMFNFNDSTNPLSKLDDWGSSAFASGSPKIEKIKWWPNPLKSPLDIKNGKNYFTVDPDSVRGYPFLLTAIGTVAEFYSVTTGDQQSNVASDFRIVDSAWRNPSVKGSLGGVGRATVNYRVNDKPVTDILGRIDITHTTPNLPFISFDLSAKADHSASDNPNVDDPSKLADYSEYVISGHPADGNVTSPGSPGGDDGMKEFPDWESYGQALKGG